MHRALNFKNTHINFANNPIISNKQVCHKTKYKKKEDDQGEFININQLNTAILFELNTTVCKSSLRMPVDPVDPVVPVAVSPCQGQFKGIHGVIKRAKSEKDKAFHKLL